MDQDTREAIWIWLLTLVATLWLIQSETLLNAIDGGLEARVTAATMDRIAGR